MAKKKIAAKKTVTTKRVTARAIARTAVAMWFEDQIYRHIPDDHAPHANLSMICDDVEAALDRECPGSDPGTFAADAGYLIGVEVGLRLRGAR